MFVVGSYDHFLSVSPFFSQPMSSSNPIGVGRVNKWTRNSERREPGLTEVPENAGIEETIRACGQPMQKSMIDRAHADLYRDDNRLSKIPESCDLNHAQFRRKEYA